MKTSRAQDVRHLLMVDDDPECLRALSARLFFAFRDQKLVVDTAESASAAIILASEHIYDCMVVDVMMPGINGFKFVEQVQGHQPDVPTIMMSGLTHDHDDLVARLHLFAFLQKPIDFPELRGLVAAALQHGMATPSEEVCVHCGSTVRVAQESGAQ